MVFALIPVVLVVVVVVVLLTRKGSKSSAAEPTEWPTPESNRPGPSKFSEMTREASVPLAPTPRPAKDPVAPATPSPSPSARRPDPVEPADDPASDPVVEDVPTAPASVADPVVPPPAPVVVPAATGPAEPAEPADDPAAASAADADPDAVDDDDEAVVDEPDLSRFGIPSERKVVAVPEMPKAQVRHLELPPVADADPVGSPGAEAPVDDVPAGDAPAAETPAAETPDPDDEPETATADGFEPVVVVQPEVEVAADVDAVTVEALEFEDATLSLEFDVPDAADPEEALEPAATVAPPDEPAGAPAGDPEPAVAVTVDLTDGADEDDAAAIDVARVDAEAELDRVIGALIDRARATDQSVVEVATELVERANLDEKEATDTLATLMDGDDTTDIIDIAGRLSELTLFNELVPSKPGALTQFGDLDPLTRKRVIVRVLCLLVAKSESDLKALPKNPASAAETRQWPLARAVWPVPAKKPGADDADLPNRDFGVRR